MSRNFHNLHVQVTTPDERERIVAAVLAYAARAGFERIARTAAADRIVRIGGKGRWISIEDDGYEIGPIADAVTEVVTAPLLEAYCEASAIVSLELLVEGKRRGGWGTRRLPAARFVKPILIQGTPASFAAAWDEAIQQVFPETALAVAAQHFGIEVERMFGDVALRGHTLALRRVRGKWTPRYHQGPPSFELSMGGNSGWGNKHLLFEGQADRQHVLLRSTGGPGRGLALRLAGSAIEQGLIEVVGVAQEQKPLPRIDDAWRDPSAQIPAGLVDEPNHFELGRSEQRKVQAIVDACERRFAFELRASRQGEGTLTTIVESGASRAETSMDLVVMWKPWRPRSAPRVDDGRLFSMHRSEHVYAHVTLRDMPAAAWAWARPHVEAWARAHGDQALRVSCDDRVIRHDHENPSWDRVAELLPVNNVPFQVAGKTFLFGTFAYPPYGVDPAERLVVQLVLGARSPDAEDAQNLAQLSAIADQAIEHGLAYSALVGMYQYRPEETTPWESVIGTDRSVALASWHETHLRGIDKRIWMAAEHAARIDRVALARHATLTELGRGLRVTVADEAPRRALAPLEELLGVLLSSPS